MKRVVQPELLDALPATDPRAVHSRRDLRRVNALMSHRLILARALRRLVGETAPRALLELGAGDGEFLRRVARELAPHWPHVRVTLLDQCHIVSEATLDEFKALGWPAEILVQDVRDWVDSGADADVVVANLFLHHFADAELVQLFSAVAKRARAFAAVEPRRHAWPLFCGRLLWLVGCNSVTSHDAAVSVRAGFSGCELSALWPPGDKWKLSEGRAGLFSHLFTARRTS